MFFGDSTRGRDFARIKDITSVARIALEREISGEICNVGAGISLSFNAILDLIYKVVVKVIRADYVANPFINYQIFTQADFSKSKN